MTNDPIAVSVALRSRVRQYTFSIHPSPTTPPWTTAKKIRYAINWVGDIPVSLLEVQAPGGDWRPQAPALPNPSPLLPSARLRRPCQWFDNLALDALWSPIDFARWSGPGLQSARVVDLSMNTNVLTVAGGFGGAAQWDGESWAAVEAPGLNALLPITAV